MEQELRELFDGIKDLKYVVQRNWKNLPNSYLVDGHGDLDLFSTDEDKPKILDMLANYPEIPCDVRSPEDDYYPYEISMMLLEGRIKKPDGFYIPNPMAAFFALYYHNLIHKNNDPYRNELERRFKSIFPPVRCKDPGVGFYDHS